MNFITLSLILLTVFNIRASSQQLQIKLETDKSEYNREDSVLITCRIKNTSADIITFLNKGYFDADKRCFVVYRYDKYLYINSNNEQHLDNFRILHPGEEVIIKDTVNISWLCRSAPPRGDWNITFYYLLNVNDSDNYYIINDSEDKKRKVILFDAWAGSVSSNKINIIIKRPD